jgi:hypothetical protein
MSGGGLPMFGWLVLAVVALGLVGVAVLGIYLISRKPSGGGDRKAGS